MPLTSHECVPKCCSASYLYAHNCASHVFDHRCHCLNKVGVVRERDEPDVMGIIVYDGSVYEYLKDLLDDLELGVSNAEFRITRDN
jgi:hypothetical protein